MMLHGFKTLPPAVAHLVKMLDAELVSGPATTVAYAKEHKKDAEEHKICLTAHHNTGSTPAESTSPRRVTVPTRHMVECRNPGCQYGGLKTHSHPL